MEATVKTCGTCRLFSPDPDVPITGVCFFHFKEEQGDVFYQGVDRDNIGCTHWEAAQTNWQKFFGTPERAAGFLIEMCHGYGYCDHCPLKDQRSCPGDKGALIWLENEVGQ